MNRVSFWNALNFIIYPLKWCESSLLKKRAQLKTVSQCVFCESVNGTLWKSMLQFITDIQTSTSSKHARSSVVYTAKLRSSQCKGICQRRPWRAPCHYMQHLAVGMKAISLLSDDMGWPTKGPWGLLSWGHTVISQQVHLRTKVGQWVGHGCWVKRLRDKQRRLGLMELRQGVTVAGMRRGQPLTQGSDVCREWWAPWGLLMLQLQGHLLWMWVIDESHRWSDGPITSMFLREALLPPILTLKGRL